MKWEKARDELQLNGVPLSAMGYCKLAFDLGQEARPRYDDLMQHLDSLQEKLRTLEAEQVAWRLFTREANSTMDQAERRTAELVKDNERLRTALVLITQPIPASRQNTPVSYLQGLACKMLEAV